MTAYVIGVLRELQSQAAWEEYLKSAAKSFPRMRKFSQNSELSHPRKRTMWKE